jgi:hypothetical protein
MKSIIATAAALVLATSVQGAFAQDPSGGGSAQPAIVSHIKVLSDKVEDVSSMEAWKNSFIKPGMSEMDKALAIWTTVVKFRHQHNPPNEYLEDDNHVHDPIKDYNVYGYGQCCCASANVEAFARYVGMETRGWGISHHSVPEIKINGKWSMLDGSLVNYFKLPDGSIAGVKEISDSVTEWFKDKPELLDPKTKHPYEDHEHYYKIMRKGQWRKGPTVLRGSVGYDENGWLPAHTHAWGDSLIEFGHGDDINFLFEYGVALGYEVNVQLRPGEKLIRNWSNKDLNINDDNKSSREILKSNPQDPTGDMRYAPKFGDLAEGRAGNGILEYTPPLNSLAATALTYDNLTIKDQHLVPAAPGKPGTFVLRMPSSYVYLTGQLELAAVGSVAVSYSDNNGLDWKPITPLSALRETGVVAFDLKPLVYRRYDYRLKFELKSPDASISALKIIHDIQHSQRVLPILDKGDTKISFSAGAPEGTITIEGNLPHNGTDPVAAKNLLFSAFHPTLKNVEPKNFTADKGAGSVTIPVQTPGDMTRIRLGAFWHASKPEDKWTVDVSFDNGKSFAPFTTLAGPNIGNSAYVTFGGGDKVPANSRNALIRLASNAAANNSLWLQQLRIDADYKEPHGGFAPVKVTYAWEENGEPKTNTHIATSPTDTYTIHCETKPRMKSITLELAQ